MKELLATLSSPSAAEVDGDLEADLLRRHLGLPPGAEVDSTVKAVVTEARDWYRRHGAPWVGGYWVEVERIDGATVHLEDGTRLSSAALARGFADARVHAMAVVAVSAGSGIDEQIDRWWREERPAEAMFLSAYGSAVAEHLRAREVTRLASTLGGTGVRLLPHYSPGYEGWGLRDQATLHGLLTDAGPLRLLPSAGLVPAKSTIAALGATRSGDLGCDPASFWFQRRTATPGPGEPAGAAPRYAFPERALARWSRERLSVTPSPDGTLHTRFRFDGTTCSSLGLALRFDYRVELRPDPSVGYRIAGCSTEPAEGDTAHRMMCAYRADPDGFRTAVRTEAPLVGQPLEDALRWTPDVSPSGCLCLAPHRDHKWRMVFQTLHYALGRSDTDTDTDTESGTESEAESESGTESESESESGSGSRDGESRRRTDHGTESR